MNELKSIDNSILEFSDDILVNLLLFGDSRFHINKNKLILEASIDYIVKSNRFSGPLF